DGDRRRRRQPGADPHRGVARSGGVRGASEGGDSGREGQGADAADEQNGALIAQGGVAGGGLGGSFLVTQDGHAGRRGVGGGGLGAGASHRGGQRGVQRGGLVGRRVEQGALGRAAAIKGVDRRGRALGPGGKGVGGLGQGVGVQLLQYV